MIPRHYQPLPTHLYFDFSESFRLSHLNLVIWLRPLQSPTKVAAFHSPTFEFLPIFFLEIYALRLFARLRGQVDVVSCGNAGDDNPGFICARTQAATQRMRTSTAAAQHQPFRTHHKVPIVLRHAEPCHWTGRKAMPPHRALSAWLSLANSCGTTPHFHTLMLVHLRRLQWRFTCSMKIIKVVLRSI